MTTLLLARHILRTMFRQRSRTLMVWVALAMALAVVVGVLTFVSSIESSFKDRGKAIRGISATQVSALGHDSLSSHLADRLEKIPGTRHAVAVTGQRVTLRSKRKSVVATAYGVDRDAKYLQSAMERELKVKMPKRAGTGGLSISTEMARRLKVKKGDHIRIFAFQRSPRIRVARVFGVSPQLDDVITLPRDRLEDLRGTPGRPNLIYIQLKDGTSVETWKKRAEKRLPRNATLTTPADQQKELDHVLDFAVRSYTYSFGAVALTIVGLLIYVLQLMRMLERQEDAGLVRALGSRWTPLARAEVLVLAGILAAAVIPGTLVGRRLAFYLNDQLPTYLTDVFNFSVQVNVQPGVVALAVGAALGLGALATVGALVATRRPVADQLGRAPQAGATSTARISPLAALIMLVVGGTCMVLSYRFLKDTSFELAGVLSLLGVGILTPGVTALILNPVSRVSRGEGRTLLIARSAVEAYPRRVAFSAAIVALGIASVVPLQLLDNSIAKRSSRHTGALSRDTQRVIASDDAFFSVPMNLQYVRQVIKEPKPKRPARKKQAKAVKVPTQAGAALTPDEAAKAKAKAHREQAEKLRRRRARELRRPLPHWAQPIAIDFTSHEGEKIATFGIDSRRAHRLYRRKEGASKGFPALRRNKNGILVSEQLSSWTNVGVGDRMKLKTPSGVRNLKVVGVVDDISWPTGTVYFDIHRYRKLYKSWAMNALAVEPGHLREQKLSEMRPLHVISAQTLINRVLSQFDKVAQSLLAMRFLTVLAALIAVGGIFATSVFARRREWGILRAMGMKGGSLLRPLAIEAFLIMAIGGVCGVFAGIATFKGPVMSLVLGQGIIISSELALIPVAMVVAGAVLAGTLTVAVPAWLMARIPVTEALAYE